VKKENIYLHKISERNVI